MKRVSATAADVLALIDETLGCWSPFEARVRSGWFEDLVWHPGQVPVMEVGRVLLAGGSDQTVERAIAWQLGRTLDPDRDDMVDVTLVPMPSSRCWVCGARFDRRGLCRGCVPEEAWETWTADTAAEELTVDGVMCARPRFWRPMVELIGVESPGLVLVRAAWDIPAPADRDATTEMTGG